MQNLTVENHPEAEFERADRMEKGEKTLKEAEKQHCLIGWFGPGGAEQVVLITRAEWPNLNSLFEVRQAVLWAISAGRRRRCGGTGAGKARWLRPQSAARLEGGLTMHIIDGLWMALLGFLTHPATQGWAMGFVAMLSGVLSLSMLPEFVGELTMLPRGTTTSAILRVVLVLGGAAAFAAIGAWLISALPRP